MIATLLVGLFSHSALLAQGWEDPVERFAEVADADAVIKRLGSRSRAIFHDDDVLTFACWSDAREVSLLTMFGASIEAHGRDGYHVGRVSIPNSDRLIMSYAFTENDAEGWDDLDMYRGVNAPQLPQSVERIAGEHFEYALESEHLGERRLVEVYVPTHLASAKLPVVYMTDGGALGDYARALDWQIEHGAIAPVILVGMHSGGYIGDRELRHRNEFDHRALEYLKGLGDERYAMHGQFMLEEVIPFVEERHPASSRREDRILSGYSNGGAYAVTAAVDHPDVFGSVFAYSVAFFVRETLRDEATDKSLPKFAFAAGELERFIRGTRDAHGILNEVGAEASIRTYVAGHDPLLWKIALLEDLQRQFPGERED